MSQRAASRRKEAYRLTHSPAAARCASTMRGLLCTVSVPQAENAERKGTYSTPRPVMGYCPSCLSWRYRMIRMTTLALTLVLASAPAAALAQPTPAPHHDAMKHDAMTHGAMAHGAMAHSAMTHSAMKHDAMKHDAMAKPTPRP